MRAKGVDRIIIANLIGLITIFCFLGYPSDVKSFTIRYLVTNLF